MKSIPDLVDAIVEGGDFHSAVAAEMFDKDINDITFDERETAKRRMMKAIYSDVRFVDEIESAEMEKQEETVSIDDLTDWASTDLFIHPAYIFDKE
jgi:hypothetical protein